MNLVTALAFALLSAAPAGGSPRLFTWGSDPAAGILVNYTVGMRPFDPPDPSRPTVVVVHGLNPLHPVMHVTVAQRYAEALGSRWGNSVNVLGWDWNSIAPLGVCLESDQHRAVSQGQALARALLERGLDPGRVHLIGQSTGCTLAAAAARQCLDLSGRPLDRLTLLDPVAFTHGVIFDTLSAGTAASRVEHYWVPGTSGYGAPCGRARVVERAIPGPRKWRGVINPFRSDHMYAVEWHIRWLAASGY